MGAGQKQDPAGYIFALDAFIIASLL